VGEWDTDGLVGHDVACRRHLLTFLVDEPRGGDFAPVAAVNATTFFGAPPGAVLCHGAYVTKLVEAPGAGATEQEILAAGKDQWWALLYNMHELSSLGWNTALPPTLEKGKARRIPTDLFPPFDMAMFFGALDFPVGEPLTARAEATPGGTDAPETGAAAKAGPRNISGRGAGRAQFPLADGGV
jgi:hypothetical protein